MHPIEVTLPVQAWEDLWIAIPMTHRWRDASRDDSHFYLVTPDGGLVYFVREVAREAGGDESVNPDGPEDFRPEV